MSRIRTVVSSSIAVLIATAGLLAPLPAAATNINTSAFGCLPSFPYNQTNAGLGASLTGSGGKPDAIAVTGSFSELLACPISRSPLASGLTNAVTFIDGKQPSGNTMSCTVQSYDFTNTFLGSTTVSATTATFDMAASLPAANAPTFAYFIASCLLNTGGNQKLLGFTTVQ
jgi:hypothetical protein